MNFVHPYLLLLVPVPLLWIAYGWRTAGRRTLHSLKGLSLAAILLALAEPVMTLPDSKTAEIILVDTSASIPAGDLARASSLARQIQADRGRNIVKVVPFDSHVRSVRQAELTGGLQLQEVAATAETRTNLEGALTGSLAAIPSGYLPRLLLISDGNENAGSAVRAIAQLQRLGIPVDTIALGGKTDTGLRLQSVSMPARAYSEELIPIDLTLLSSSAGPASVNIHAAAKDLGRQEFQVREGENSVRVNARVKSTGVISVAGRIESTHGQARFEQAIELRRAGVLYLSEDPGGSDANLLSALKQADFEVSRDASALDGDLHAFQLVILNNLDLGSISGQRKNRIESFVKNGGGLLLISGERQVYKEDKQMDALDRALPAKLAPPDTPKGICVALIIDKSSSMEGRKIELARLSAIGVVDHLKPVDSIGVLIFDNSFQWAVPMRHAEDKPMIKRLISGITPDGGTQIAPALAEAYRRVLPSNSNFKHIVLLTDGISEEGDSVELAREASQHEVTISTVGLGQDVNRSYLEKVAATSGGRSYFLNEPMGLEQILLKDVETFSGSTSVEKSLVPLLSERSDVLEGVGMENAPPLRGYVRFKAKPGSETLLQINAAKKDPLYVHWQYGLGRAAVFTSDAKSRWAEPWIGWPGFDKFWTNAARDLLTRVDRSEASASYDSANGDLVLRYRLSDEVGEPVSVPPIYAFGPNGFRKPVEVKETARYVYEGRVHIGDTTGLFRARPLSDSTPFEEVGLYRSEPELADYGSNEALLREVSAFTGGRFEPALTDIFARGERSNASEWRLWPACLSLAIALTIAELVARKWSGLIERFRRS